MKITEMVQKLADWENCWQQVEQEFILEKQNTEITSTNQPIMSPNMNSMEWNNDMSNMPDHDMDYMNDAHQDDHNESVNEEEEEEEEELCQDGQSICLLHGVCDHLTSNCTELLKKLAHQQYRLEKCDPRLSRRPIAVPAVPVDNVDKKSALDVVYEDNRASYNYL